MKLKSLIAVFFLALLAGPDAYAGTDNSTRPEVRLLELINDLRARPVQVIEERGFEPAEFIRELPAMKEVFTRGLTPLDLNEALNTSARDHLDDMREKGYYSKKSPDGRLPYDRMSAAGYPPEKSAEVLAMLGFRNFIDSSRAVNIIFSRILEEELDKSSLNELTILSPHLENIGIAFDSATVSSGNISFNSYLTVCDLADHTLSDIEQDVFKQLNLIRQDPEAYATEIGMDFERLYKKKPELEEFLTSEFTPFTIDSRLMETVKQRTRDILADSTDWPDQELVSELLAENGWTDLRAQESTRMLITVDQNEPLPAALENLARIFRKELSSSFQERHLLNPEYDLAGIRLEVRRPGEWVEPGGETSSYHVILLELVLGTKNFNTEDINLWY